MRIDFSDKKSLYELLRFGIVGVFATGIHYAIYLLLLKTVTETFAYTVGYVISFVFNFVLTNLFTFKTKPSVLKGIGFVASHGINYFLQIILLNIFINSVLGETYAPIAVYAIAVPVNFLLIRFVFKKMK